MHQVCMLASPLALVGGAAVLPLQGPSA